MSRLTQAAATISPDCLRVINTRFRRMSSLDEQDKQLFATLLNQADAVAPPVVKEHDDFAGSDTDDHAFRLLNRYINSEMGEVEQMHFEQQASASEFEHSHSAEGHQPDQASNFSNPTTRSYSNPATPSFKSPATPGFNKQQAGYNSVQSPLQIEPTSASAYHAQDASHVYQQVQPSPGQLTINTAQSGSGFQQQYGSSTSPVDKGSVASGFGTENQAYSAPAQVEHGDQATNAYFNQNASFQTQTHQQSQNQQQTFQQPATQQFYQHAGQTGVGGAPDVAGSSTASEQANQGTAGTFNTHVAPSASQGDQGSGVMYSGQVTDYVSGQGQVSGFQKPASYTPVPSPAQGRFDNSMPSSPASNYQQPSPGFALQSAYPTHSQRDQNAGTPYSPQSADYSPPSHPDQSVNQDGYQGQPSPFSTPHTPSHSESGPVQTGYQQYPAASSSMASSGPQPMQCGGSGPSSLDSALEFIHKTLSEGQQGQVVGGPAPVQYQQVVPPGHVDQPMDTQQSHYITSSGGGFSERAPVSSFAFSGSCQAPVGSMASAATAVCSLMNQAPGSGVGFCPSAVPTFSLSQQSVQQQQRAFSSQPQGSLSNSSSSQSLSSFIASAPQIHNGVSAQQAYVTQSQPTSVLGQFQSQLPANGYQQAATVQNPSPFVQGAASTVPAGSAPGIPGLGRSASASLQDSSQANVTLSLLSTVLQQIQALLPQNQQGAGQATSSIPPVVGDNPEVLTRLLHSQQGAQQVLQMLQSSVQPNNNNNNGGAGGQSVGQSQQLSTQSAGQQPNFLLQQTNQQKLLLAPQHQQSHQQQQQQQQQQHMLGVTPTQPVAAEIPSSMVTSIASGLGSLGVTIGSDGQFVIGQQPIKVVLGPPSLASSTATGLIINQASGSMASLDPSTSVSYSGPQQGMSVPVPVSPFPSELDQTGINPHLPCGSAQPMSVNLTHSINTPLTPVSHIGSTFSKTTFVLPTASFTQPLPVASVGLGVTGSNQAQLSIPAGTASPGVSGVANILFPDSSAAVKAVNDISEPASPQVGNFLNVTTGGSASMLLNAFSLAAGDKTPGFKVGPFTPSSVAMDIGDMDADKPENLTPRHFSRKSSGEDELDQKGDSVANSMLRRILTMREEDGGNNGSKPDSPSPPDSPTGQSPPIFAFDGNTQATLIEKSENLKLCSDGHDEEMPPELWTSFVNVSDQEVIPSKLQRGMDDLDTSSRQVTPSVEKLFDAGGAASSSAFVFTKFGAEVSNTGIRAFGLAGEAAPSPGITAEAGAVSAVKASEPLKISAVPTASIRPSSRRQKDPGLVLQFPSKVGQYELRILSQPEEQHRARYLTEGSRGAVKDRSQQGYPLIKLLGYEEPATLQVFIGNEAGRIKPHGFYQACKVCGKNSTQCSEREIEGTNVIEIEISPLTDMQVNLDCVGILKLRNADVEKRIGPSKAKAKKKNSTKARLIFRCILRKPDGNFVTLQTASTPILCTQPIGQPEISRMSVSELCVNQSSDMFIIGKNFLKGTQVMFQEVGDTDIRWQAEAELEVEYFQQTHLICSIPDYPQKDIRQPVKCQIVVLSGGKISDPQDFVYKPAV